MQHTSEVIFLQDKTVLNAKIRAITDYAVNLAGQQNYEKLDMAAHTHEALVTLDSMQSFEHQLPHEL